MTTATRPASFASVHGPWLLLLVLLTLQYGLLLVIADQDSLSGDEIYYVDQASAIVQDRTLPGPLPEVERAKGPGFGSMSDYRPIGYPLLLAAMGVTRENHPARRAWSASLNFALAAVSLIVIFALFFPYIGATWAKWVGAGLLGVQPWLFEFTANFYADSLNANLFFLGTIVLALGFREDRRRRGLGLAAGGSLLLGICVFLRPEMLVFVFIPPVLLAVPPAYFGRAGTAGLRRLGVSLALILCATLLQSAHRYWFEGRFLARFVHATPGLEEWGKTWLGTEPERYRVVWGLPKGQAEFSDIPSRAFGDELERKAVREALRTASGEEGYSARVDSVFMRVAERRRDSWLTGIVIPRTWFMVHLWVTTTTNAQTHRILSGLDGLARKGILGLFFLLKMGILIAPFTALVALTRRPWRRYRYLEVLAVVSIAVFALRTFYIGFLQAQSEHRYVLLAVPFVLLLVMFELARIAASGADPTRTEDCREESLLDGC